MADEDAGAAIDKTLGQLLVQGIAEAVLDIPGLFAPMRRIFKPIPTVSNEGPGADLADAVRQRVDIARCIVAEAHLLGNPVRFDAAIGPEIGVDAGDDLAVLGRRNVPVIGDLAAFPEQVDRFAGGGVAGRLVARQELERVLVGRGGHPGQRLVPRRPL